MSTDVPSRHNTGYVWVRCPVCAGTGEVVKKRGEMDKKRSCDCKFCEHNEQKTCNCDPCSFLRLQWPNLYAIHNDETPR